MGSKIHSLQFSSRSIYLILSLCYIGIVFSFSSMPGDFIGIGNSTIERSIWNLAHIPFYGILAILLSLTLRDIGKKSPCFLYSVWSVLIISMSIAILDELNQASINGRSASVVDLLLDGIGIITALWIIHGRQNYLRLRKTTNN